ncbi:MAG TPA: di-heme oxidoredictase family protein, partial [Verrucomicrobiae bacterium]|nr:di-heme oxidoredictase family protein [Verrucomicrobiae bacterium]
PPAPEPGEELSGGEKTVFDATKNAFGFPLHNLKEEHRASFFVGHSFFNNNWVVAPASTAGRDGLGPLFNARSCSACHFKDGRSKPPDPAKAMVAMLMRISVPGKGSHHEPMPDPIYGGQIQGQGIPGVPPEADVFVEYEERSGRFADGQEFSLRKPVYQIKNLGYGPLAKNAMTSPRVAPGMIGLGLLEAVPEETLRSLAAAQRRNGDGISGRLNLVWDSAAGKTMPGRFGWKAEQPTVRQQTATAFVEDIGITSSVMPCENYTAHEGICAKQPSGGSPEVSDKILHDVVAYSCTLAVPARRNWTDATVARGKELFSQANCAACHAPKLQTGESAEFPELSNQTIHPYTDLLLHDMGEGLADGRPVFEAGGRDWRTPPLWGIGLVSKVNGHTCFLHDGRARNLAEAILWHDGEARVAREKFQAFPRVDRDALIAFLQSL